MSNAKLAAALARFQSVVARVGNASVLASQPILTARASIARLAVELRALTDNPIIDELVTAADSSYLTIIKNLEDFVEAIESAEVYNQGNDKFDLVAAVDQLTISLQFLRSFEHAVATDDVAALSLTKSIEDAVTAVEGNFSAVVANLQSPADIAAVGEALAFNVSKLLDDAPIATDSVSIQTLLAFADFVSVADNLQFQGSNEQFYGDQLSVGDSGSLLMQDYADITYFADDYVGTSRTF